MIHPARSSWNGSLIAISLFLVSVAPAAAGQLFFFNYSFPGSPADQGGGYFDTQNTAGSTYSVLSAQGFTNFGAITGLSPVGSEGSNDNLLFYPSTPHLDTSGITFGVTGAGDEGSGLENLFFSSALNGYTDLGPTTNTGTFILTPVDAVFSFSYDITSNPGPNHTGQGFFGADYNPVTKQYIVQGAAGTTNFGLITGLSPVGSEGGNDNLLLYPNTPYLDQNGITFGVTGAGDTGRGMVNLFQSNSLGFTDLSSTTGSGILTLNLVALSSAAVPEPSSWILAVPALLAVLAWRRFGQPRHSTR